MRTSAKLNKTERTRREARLSARITEETKREAERAASYEQISFTAFIERAIREKAHAVIYAHEVLDIGAEASQAMIDAWLTSAPLPTKLAEALARHDATVLSDL